MRRGREAGHGWRRGPGWTRRNGGERQTAAEQEKEGNEESGGGPRLGGCEQRVGCRAVTCGIMDNIIRGRASSGGLQRGAWIPPTGQDRGVVRGTDEEDWGSIAFIPLLV